MPWRRTPMWISLGGAWLALAAGFVNAIGYLGVAQRGLTHVTGQVTQLAIEVTHGQASTAAWLVVSFFLGAVCSGVIIRREELSTSGSRYGVVLLLEAALLALAAVLMPTQRTSAECLITLAMGMQNALATSYSGAVVRTTHVTGLATDLGLLIGHALKGAPVEAARIRLHALLFVSFVLGAALGAWCFTALGDASLFVPAAALALASVGWLVVSKRRVSAASPSR